MENEQCYTYKLNLKTHLLYLPMLTDSICTSWGEDLMYFDR